MQDRYVTLAHGNGGRYMRELIAEIFARHLANPGLDVSQDSAPMTLDSEGTPFITTDGFIVQPPTTIRVRLFGAAKAQTDNIHFIN